MKIATVPYLNTKPLVMGLEVMRYFPSDLLEKLKTSDIDVALVPVLDAFAHDLYPHPDCGLIGCDGEVLSVGLATRPGITALSQINTFCEDPESRTSNKLAWILLTHFQNRDPAQITMKPWSERFSADAYVIIGDKALFGDIPSGWTFWDLGKLWKAYTNLGFVFAVWASKRPLTLAEKDILISARAQGLNSIQKIGSELALEQRQLVEKYLENNIRYELSASIEKGLQLFLKLK